MATDPSIHGDAALIIYDGDCIFCQNYVRFIRLREAVGPVDLVDARSNDPRVERYWKSGYDLNEGMLFVNDGRVYHGHEAINALADLSTSSTLFNRLNRALLSNAFTARTIYPFLKFGRRLTLLARGRRLLDSPAP